MPHPCERCSRILYIARMTIGSLFVEPASIDRDRCTRVFRSKDLEKTRAAVLVSEMLLHRLHGFIEGVVAPADRSIMFAG